jgi:hypothetical protein
MRALLWDFSQFYAGFRPKQAIPCGNSAFARANSKPKTAQKPWRPRQSREPRRFTVADK